MKRTRLYPFLWILALCAGLLFPAASARAEGAGDCFFINVDLLDMGALRNNDYVASHLSSQAAGIRVQKYISNSDELAARIRLTILRVDTNTLIFDKNYSYQSMTFDSGDIYLPFPDIRTVPYLITLYIEDWVYAMPFMHQLPRLAFNGACTYGVRMRDYNPALTSNWLMGTMIDLELLRLQGRQTVPLCASNAYLVGEAVITLTGDVLTVSLSFDPQANVELHHGAVYCIPWVSTLTSADPPYMPESAWQIGAGIDVSGLRSVLLYLPLSISYDCAGLSGFSYDLWESPALREQLALWNENLAGGTGETREPTEPPAGAFVPETAEPPVEPPAEPPYAEPAPPDPAAQPAEPEALPPVEPYAPEADSRETLPEAAPDTDVP